MGAGPSPPIPGGSGPDDGTELVDPKTGQRVATGDVREEFARISAEVGRDPAAERAFVESKIEMIRTHPTLTEAEKAAAIRELEDMLKEQS